MEDGNCEEVCQERKWFMQKARRLACFCYDNNFLGVECLYGLKMGRLAAFYNGIGPDWKWSVIVRIVEHLDLIFEPAAFIQDIQYRIAENRSASNFHKVNREFYENCLRCIELGTEWWRFFRRMRLRKSARVLYEESERHGMESWLKNGVRE